MLNPTPCISFDVGEASEIIGNSGFIIPDSSILSVLETLKSALYCLNFSILN